MPEVGAAFSVAAADGCGLVGRTLGRTDGWPVILAHPIGFDGRFWRAASDRLVSRFALVTPDARGHGGSARGTSEASISRLADDVIAVMDALHVEKAGFVGCSMGGMVGMHLAAAHPERINWLVLANAPARIPLPRELFDQRIAAARSGGYPELARGMLARWISPGAEAARPDWYAARLEEMLQTEGDGFADAFAALRDYDGDADLPRISAPALIVTGAFDGGFPPDAAAGVAAKIPGGEVAVIAGTGHLAPVESPHAFSDLVIAFAGAALGVRAA